MKQRKGISLIVLVVTIIVMIIIAGAIIISLNNANVIDRGQEAVEKHNQKSIEEAIILVYQELLVEKLGKVTVADLTQKVEELSIKYKEIQNVTAGNEKVTYTLSLTGKRYDISTKTGKITEYVESARVPFTYYIEDGPYYYVSRYEDSTIRSVITISRESAEFILYNNTYTPYSYDFEMLDKLEAIAELGITEDVAEQAIGISFNEVNDDTLFYTHANGPALNVFKSNYTKMLFENIWYTLDTSFELPAE